MAVSIDAVYQRVLAIANKEQRGYITPQEFNLFANQAQEEIFEQYFYDVNQFNRIHGNSTDHSDMLTLLDEKIEIFEALKSVTFVVAGFGLGSYDITGSISDLYRVNMITYTDTSVSPEAIIFEKVTEKEFLMRQKSPLTKASSLRPIYAVGIDGHMTNLFTSITPKYISVSYIRKPKKVQWGYFVINDKALHDVSASKTTNFELHASEESELVHRILIYAGITLQKPQLTQVAAGLEGSRIQQEKQ
tara:strand:+ start:29 stop:769 length:741 start_codon:yes stop_codon:yes gene_type:complete